MTARLFLTFCCCVLSIVPCQAQDGAPETPSSLKIEQSAPEKKEALSRLHAPPFDPYADDRLTNDELYDHWPSPNDATALRLALPLARGGRQDDLYRDWLSLNAVTARDAERVAAANRDFVSPLSYDLFGMSCMLLACAIPKTSCVVSLFPPMGACAF